MDCTYKTNRYKMPLMVINGVTGINKTFYVGFAFLSGEHAPDFEWVCTQLKDLYDSLEIEYPQVILTDCEVGLISALRFIFPRVTHLLCI